MHVNTRRNLHSHVYSSHLSNGQEVSAYGENGVGDHGDDWTVGCSTGNWKRDAEVRFKHVQVMRETVKRAANLTLFHNLTSLNLFYYFEFSD